MNNSNDLKLILVSGAWGSGTTAVAGALAYLGFTGLGPYYVTNDERTQNSFELVPFRDLIQGLASEQKVRITEKSKQHINQEISLFRQRILNQEFGYFDPLKSPPLFLKYPLSALLISELSAQFNVRLIVVTRPLDAIEKTRLRRYWPSYLGAKGADVIYPHIFDTILNEGVPAYFVHYPHLLRNPEPYIRTITHFCGYIPDDINIDNAVRSISESPAAVAAASTVKSAPVAKPKVVDEPSLFDQILRPLRRWL